MVGKLVRFLIIALLLSVLGAGCDIVGHPRQGREIGLSITEQGDVLVLYNPCVEDRVSAVRLVLVAGSVFGDEDDIVLWSMETADPVHLEAFRIGTSVAGFLETLPLTAPLSGALGVQLFLTNGEEFDGRQFKSDELRTGVFLNARDEYLSREAFLALDTCRL